MEERPDIVYVKLSRSEWRLILNAVLGYDDCGPAYEGWKSSELSKASAALEVQLGESGIR